MKTIYYLKNSEHAKRKAKERYYRLRNQGKCPCCAKDINAGEVYCDVHIISNRETNWKRRQIRISHTEYLDLLKLQNGVCKLCSKKPLDMELAVDHDHTSGTVRGLLCRKCNQFTGKIDNNRELTKKILEYLKVYL